MYYSRKPSQSQGVSLACNQSQDGMQSFRRNLCNQSEGKYTYGDTIHAMRDYIRLTAITYQSFGLDKNKALPKGDTP